MCKCLLKWFLCMQVQYILVVFVFEAWKCLFCSKRFQSLTGQETVGIGMNQVDSSVASPDLDSLKQEILAEVRREINKAKLEIIEGWFLTFHHKIL